MSTSPTLAERHAEARQRLDQHVRETVAWHFDPGTGSPFWLDFASRLGFDPRERIHGYGDLPLLGHFQDEWLRGGPVRRFLPRGLAGRPVSVFETGGSTGTPKCRVNVDDFRIDYELLSESLPEAGFPRGADWLMLGPTGPRRLRLSIEHLAQHRGGIAFHVDLDPRWVNQLIREGRPRELDAYKRHVVDQGLTLLRAHDGIRCVFTTPKLLQALCERISLARMGIRGIFCGGTEMTPQFHRFAREELVPGIEFFPVYGNTMMGLACPKPFDPADGWSITYYPPWPRAVVELVDPEDPERAVGYGETGRVMLTTLTREFFMPRFLERDEGERAAPVDAYPWDGVSDVRLLSSLQESVVVGVY